MRNELGDLKHAIIALQQKRSIEREILAEQLYETYESIKPISLIKSTLKQVSSSSELKDKLIGNFMGIGTGILSRKFWVGSSHNPIKRLLGALIQFTITNVVSKNAEGIKNTGAYLLNHYLPKRKSLIDELPPDANILSGKH